MLQEVQGKGLATLPRAPSVECWIFALLYGSMLWGLIPRHGVSFTGHLFGALSGIGVAWLMHRDDSTDEKLHPYAEMTSPGGGDTNGSAPWGDT